MIKVFNLRMFRQSLGMSQMELASEVGITQSYISEMEKGKKQVSDEALAKIIDRFGKDLVETWMVEKNTNENKSVINYKEGVPYYDEDFVLGFNELGFPSSENPQFLVRIPQYNNATLWCKATGDSMQPEINSGDVIALKLIEDPSFLLLGDLYAIVTKNGLRTIKRLGKGKDEDHYRMIPTNKHYDDQELPKSMILRVFKVLGNLHSF